MARSSPSLYLPRVAAAQVSKKCFDEVVQLLEQAERPTRLVFVRHACGRRFRDHREGARRLASPGNSRSRGSLGTPGSSGISLPSPRAPDGWLSLTPSPGRMKKKRRQPAEVGRLGAYKHRGTAHVPTDVAPSGEVVEGGFCAVGGGRSQD